MRAAALAIAVLATACQIQTRPSYQYPAPQYYATPAPAPTYTTAAAAPTTERRLTFNGHAATAQDLQIVAQLEARWGQRVPDGNYWYDDMSGAAGVWGGPARGVLPAGLHLGGPLPANASGGGDGSLTGVFINGRELHPMDVALLQQLVGQVYPGRWWVDGQGNFGLEGGMALGNLYQIAQAAQQRGGGGGDSYYSHDQNGSVFVGGGCVSATSHSSSGDSTYYGSGC